MFSGEPGFASYANLVDANQDGLVDRAYAVDTSGRIFKVDLVCLARHPSTEPQIAGEGFGAIPIIASQS